MSETATKQANSEPYGEEREQLAPLCLCLNGGPNERLRGRPFITDANGNVVVEGFQDGDQTGLDSHIRRLQEIVRAVNAHEALVEALRRVREAYNAGPDADRIRVAMDAAIDYVDAALAAARRSECGYCAAPQHFTLAAPMPHRQGLPDYEGLWHRSNLGGYYRCTAR